MQNVSVFFRKGNKYIVTDYITKGALEMDNKKLEQLKKTKKQ